MNQIKPDIFAAYLLSAVNILGYSILIPVLPFIVEDYGAEEWVYGLLLSTYSLFQFIGATWLGQLSDSQGRKKILLISHAGTLLSWGLFAIAYFSPIEPKIVGFALPLVIILLARIIDGITGGNSAVAEAYISDITTPEEKKTIYSTIGGVAGLGMIVGPGMGGFFASGSIGYLGTVLLAGSISTITLFFIVRYVKESLPPERRRTEANTQWWMHFRIVHRLKTLDEVPVVKYALWLKWLFTILMSIYVSTIALFVIDLFEFTERELGIFMLMVGGFLSFNQLVVVRRILLKWGAIKSLQFGLGLASVGFILITQTQSIWVYAGFYYILNLGIAMCLPSFNTIFAEHAKRENMGETMGISNGLMSLSNAMVPVIAAWTYSLIGHQIYWISSACALGGVFFVLLRLQPSLHLNTGSTKE
jgi:MFS family permease